MFKIFRISKRVLVELHFHLDTELGDWSYRFSLLPTIGVKRIGKAYDLDVCLFQGETDIHLMWLFFEVALVIEDEWE